MAAVSSFVSHLFPGTYPKFLVPCNLLFVIMNHGASALDILLHNMRYTITFLFFNYIFTSGSHSCLSENNKHKQVYPDFTCQRNKCSLLKQRSPPIVNSNTTIKTDKISLLISQKKVKKKKRSPLHTK